LKEVRELLNRPANIIIFYICIVQNEVSFKKELVHDFNVIDENKIKSIDMHQIKMPIDENSKHFNDHRLNDIWKKAQFSSFNSLELNQLKVCFLYFKIF
jgi:hypothetical protein